MNIEVNQRWKEGRSHYRPAGETINPSEYEIAEIPDDKTARNFICRHHYSKSYVAAVRRFGLYRWYKLLADYRLVGVAVFSVPMNPATLTKVFPSSTLDCLLDLGRFVLEDVPGNGCSWFHAEIRRRLAREGYVGEVAFADDVARTDANNNEVFGGHLGCHYKASNACLLGRGTARTLRLLPDGRVFSDRAASKVRAGERGWRYAARLLEEFGAPKVPEDPELRRAWLRAWTDRLTRRLRHPGPLKYCWALDRRVELPRSLPYPKIKFSDRQPVLLPSELVAY